MAPRSKSTWLVPAGLVTLSLVPAIAGTVRLSQLVSGVATTADNARFVEAPLPVALHIVNATAYSLLGAFLFSPGLRRRWPAWHRAVGRVLVGAGIAAALTGLWMAHFYAWPRYDGYAVYWMRLVVGTAMIVFLVRGVTAILRRDVRTHEAMMMRAYALGLGAGTQVLTHIPYFVFPSIQGTLSRAICMGAGWAINYAVAEWVIWRATEKAVDKPARSGVITGKSVIRRFPDGRNPFPAPRTRRDERPLEARLGQRQ
jgi:uncharacterized membrane protein